MRLVRFIFAFFLPLAGALAQSARWEPAGGSLPVGQSTALRLVFEDCSPKDDPAPPKVDGLTVQLYGKSSNTSIINATISVSEVFTFAVALTKNQRVEIPAFSVETNKGTARVPAVRFEPTAATVGRTGTPLTDAASARIAINPPSVWAGEVFDLTATVEAARSYYPQFTRGFDWTADPLLAESWSDPQQIERASGGEPHTGFSYRTRALARSPGRFNLNAATHIVNLSVGVSGFGFFQQRQYDQYSITSNTPTLEVKPLPTAPPGFRGAVGQFKLTSKVVPEKAAVGEPVTWTLELSGPGNWPDIPGLPSRDVSNDFQVVQPKAKRTPAEGKIFDVTLTEDVVLVPTRAGTYALGPVNFTYFDPKSGSYKTISAPRTTVTITGPATPQFNLSPPAEQAAPTDPAPANRRPPEVPAPPGGIPRDPLPGSDTALRPLAPGTLVTWVFAPFAGLFGFWFWLALREARQTDPLRPRREAYARLAATLARLRQAPEAERSSLLLAWQRDSAVLLRLAHAAPPPSALPGTAWSALWTEADRALYGTVPALPADWISRAEAALAGRRVPGFQAWRLFLPRNLFPFAALLVLALVVVTTARAQAPDAAYRAGNFPAAEKGWRDILAKEPTDWIARHNLSLALAQQERPGESAGQAAAAFVQQPSHPAVRWHFRFAAERAGFAPGALAGFITPGPAQSLARLASPAAWQRTIVVAAFLFAAALGWMLANLYGARSRRVYLVAGALQAVAFVLAVSGIASVLTYGIAADERAVIVARGSVLRSIPTEADTAQKTTPLAAGSMAVADKTFLGWTRLAFENGQTGWVRREETVPLWK